MNISSIWSFFEVSTAGAIHQSQNCLVASVNGRLLSTIMTKVCNGSKYSCSLVVPVTSSIILSTSSAIVAHERNFVSWLYPVPMRPWRLKRVGLGLDVELVLLGNLLVGVSVPDVFAS